MSRFLRTITVFSIALAISLAAVVVMGQSAPEPINAALADLSGQVGRSVTLTDLDNWSFEQRVFSDTSLGCPQPGMMYAQVTTSGFIFTLTYAGTVYDYRVTNDQSTAILCSSTPAVAAAPVCPPPDVAGYLPPRLAIGMEARVRQGGLPNLVRDQPGGSGKLLGQIEPGTVFQVLSGPRCSTLDKIVWWQVNVNGLIGWTAEGKDGEYWLEPLNLPPATPTPVAVSPEAITAANASRIGQFATVDAVNALSPVAPMLAVGAADGTIVLNDFLTGGPVSSAPGHKAAVTALTFGMNRARFLVLLASAGADGTVVIWELDAKNLPVAQAQITGLGSAVTALAFDSTGALLAGGSEDGTLRLWDAESGQELARFSGPQSAVTRLMFHPQQYALLAQYADGLTTVWGITTEQAAG